MRKARTAEQHVILRKDYAEVNMDSLSPPDKRSTFYIEDKLTMEQLARQQNQY